MKTTTHTIIVAALDSDPTINAALRQSLLRLLGSDDPSPDLISEPEAATLLGRSQAGLNAWRRDKEKAFPFHTYPIEGTTRIHYDRNELVAYLAKTAVAPRTA